MSNATHSRSTFWRDFLAGLGGPAAAVAADRASDPSLADLVEEARFDVLRLNTERAIAFHMTDAELDASLAGAEQRRDQLKRAFDAMRDVVGPDSRFGAETPRELRLLLDHVAHVAPDATAGSAAFQSLVNAAKVPAGLA